MSIIIAAAIQEYTNFPQAEHTLPPEEIDLQERSGFGKHTLVGLNVYLLKMAWQFPDILGIRKTDPMLSDSGIDSIPTAEGAMLDQAVNRTAIVTVGDVRNQDGALSARVTVINKVGHKFPSGVGFRRAFVEFSVLDVNNKVMWASGRTNGAGRHRRRGRNNADRGRAVVEATTAPRASIPRRASTSRTTRRSRGRIRRRSIRSWCRTPPEDASAESCGPHAKPQGQLTTSFLSICAKVKDNRLLPQGFLKLEDRIKISEALGADDEDGARKPGRDAVGDDPDYQRGGSDSLIYRVPLADLGGQEAGRRAGDALLSGDAAVLPAGPLLHLGAATTPSGCTISPASSTSPARRRRTGSCASSPAGR